VVVDVDLVNVVFSVLDKKGKAIPDLNQNEISVVERRRHSEDYQLHSEAGGPVALAVLIDTSNSIRAQFKVEQEAAIDFFHTTVRRRQDKAMLMSFDSTVDILQPFTDDADLLTKAVRRLKTWRRDQIVRRGSARLSGASEEADGDAQGVGFD
jgi:VWFA-related protein